MNIHSTYSVKFVQEYTAILNTICIIIRVACLEPESGLNRPAALLNLKKYRYDMKNFVTKSRKCALAVNEI